jgi:signal transduction histidine kinase
MQAGDLTTLEVSDDGTGFDHAAVNVGHGLDNVRARAASIGAELDVSSRRGVGTNVETRWNRQAATAHTLETAVDR